jgi:protein phosphatase
LLLCSDGLCGVVPREQLAAMLAAPGPAQQAADNLFEAALAAGSEDNITAVVVAFKIE